MLINLVKQYNCRKMIIYEKSENLENQKKNQFQTLLRVIDINFKTILVKLRQQIRYNLMLRIFRYTFLAQKLLYL